MKKNKEQEILKELRNYFSSDLEEIFGGKDVKELLSNALKNFYKDHKTNWEDVNCVQSLDAIAIALKVLLDDEEITSVQKDILNVADESNIDLSHEQVLEIENKVNRYFDYSDYNDFILFHIGELK